MGKFKPSPPKQSAPKPSGPTQEQLDAQNKSEERAQANEDRTNKELSSAARFSKKRRTGRRLLLAPGREDEIAQLGSGSGATGGNF